jgi:hypothetical protein
VGGASAARVKARAVYFFCGSPAEATLPLEPKRMSVSSMYHFSTSVISGGLPLASSHPSTAYFWFEPFSTRIPANHVFVWCLYASSVLTRTIKLAERSFPMRQTLDLLMPSRAEPSRDFADTYSISKQVAPVIRSCSGGRCASIVLALTLCFHDPFAVPLQHHRTIKLGDAAQDVQHKACPWPLSCRGSSPG